VALALLGYTGVRHGGPPLLTAARTWLSKLRQPPVPPGPKPEDLLAEILKRLPPQTHP
jgi:hypothetical protein